MEGTCLAAPIGFCCMGKDLSSVSPAGGQCSQPVSWTGATSPAQEMHRIAFLHLQPRTLASFPLDAPKVSIFSVTSQHGIRAARVLTLG